MPLRLSSCSLFRFSISSGRVRFLLRLSCLSLVVVLFSPDSFFTLWVRFFFFSLVSVASFLRLSSLLSLPSALTRFLFFYLMFSPVCCIFSILSASLYSLRLLLPAPVPGFRFPFLLVPCCFCVRQGLFSLLSLWFLPHFVPSVCRLSFFTFGSHFVGSPWCPFFVF